LTMLRLRRCSFVWQNVRYFTALLMPNFSGSWKIRSDVPSFPKVVYKLGHTPLTMFWNDILIIHKSG